MSDAPAPAAIAAPVRVPLADRLLAGSLAACVLTALHSAAAGWEMGVMGRHLAAPLALFAYEAGLLVPVALLRAVVRRGTAAAEPPPAQRAAREAVGMGLFASFLLSLVLEVFIGPMAGTPWSRVLLHALGIGVGWGVVGWTLLRGIRFIRDRRDLVRGGVGLTCAVLAVAWLSGGVARLAGAVPSESPAEACARAERTAPAGDLALRAPSGRRVVLIGVDGGDLDEVVPLLKQGALPNLRGLIEGGVGMRLWSEDYVLGSPALWTTIATGVRPQGHGVDAMLTMIAPGLPPIEVEPDFIGPLNTPLLLVFYGWLLAGAMEATPPPSNCRRVPTLANVVSAAGGSVRVVGWPATWPAEAVRGEMVTERARRAPHVEVFCPFSAHLCGMTYPPELFARLEREAPGHSAVPWEELDTLAEWTAEDRSSLGEWSMSLAERRPHAFLSMVLAGDRWIARSTARLMASEGPRDLTLCAFFGVDIAAHYWYDAAHPDEGAPPGPGRERYREVIAGTWKLTDRWLGEVLAQLDEGTTVMLMSDHGMERADLLDFVAYHSRDGMLVARGPGIARRGLVAESTARLEDVAPTALRLLGYPVPGRMEGRVLEEVLEGGGGGGK